MAGSGYGNSYRDREPVQYSVKMAEHLDSREILEAYRDPHVQPAEDVGRQGGRRDIWNRSWEKLALEGPARPTGAWAQQHQRGPALHRTVRREPHARHELRAGPLDEGIGRSPEGLPRDPASPPPRKGAGPLGRPEAARTRCLREGLGPSRDGRKKGISAPPILHVGNHRHHGRGLRPPDQEGAQSLPSRKRGVDGALTVPPRVRAVPPVRNTLASSMQSPPASAEATSVIISSPVFARPGALPRLRRCRTSSGRPRCRARVAGRISPALATRR